MSGIGAILNFVETVNVEIHFSFFFNSGEVWTVFPSQNSAVHIIEISWVMTSLGFVWVVKSSTLYSIPLLNYWQFLWGVSHLHYISNILSSQVFCLLAEMQELQNNHTRDCKRKKSMKTQSFRLCCCDH